jgi:hypothetical protein
MLVVSSAVLNESCSSPPGNVGHCLLSAEMLAISLTVISVGHRLLSVEMLAISLTVISAGHRLLSAEMLAISLKVISVGHRLLSAEMLAIRSPVWEIGHWGRGGRRPAVFDMHVQTSSSVTSECWLFVL